MKTAILESWAASADHSCINSTDPLTGRRELRMHRYVAVTGKRVELKRWEILKKHKRSLLEEKT